MTGELRSAPMAGDGMREVAVEVMARAIYAAWDGGSNPWDALIQRRRELGIDGYHASQREALANARDALTALLALLDERGFVMVPKEPVREMWAAGGNAVVGYKERHHDKVVDAVWSGMLAASPNPFAEEPPHG